MPTRIREQTQLLGLPKPIIIGEDNQGEDHLITTPTNIPIGSNSITTTGNITQLNPQGSAVVLMNNASLATIQGIKAGFPGQIITIISIGAGEVDFAHQNASANASDRLINFVTSGITPLAPGVGSAIYQYDEVTARWRLVNHNQGDWINVPFNATNFSGSGSMTWTVTSGEVLTNKFILTNRSLVWSLQVSLTSVGGTLSNVLILAIPNSYQSNDSNVSMMFAVDNSTRVVAFGVNSFSVNTQVGVVKLDGSNWNASTLASSVECGNITISLK